jgi:hypothetical protein
MIDSYGWHGSVSMWARIQEMRTGRKLVAASRRDITKGLAVTCTLSDGKKIRKVTEVVTGTKSIGSGELYR